MKVLVTGFEPFGGDAVNESWQAVRGLAARWDAELSGADLVVACLPVSFADAVRGLRVLVDEHRPDVVVACGLAVGADAVRLERVAVNVADARIPDNDGERPVDVPVVAGGPAAWFATLPIKATLVALREAEIPAVVSNTAGTYVCNATFFALQHALSSRPRVRAGFVHVPRADRLDVATATAALGIVVSTAVGAARGSVVEPVLAAGTEH